MTKNDNPTPADRDARGQTPGREAFATAEEAWLWAMAAFVAHRDGKPEPAGPCNPHNMFEIVNHLYCRRRINREHANALRSWGERGTAPNPAYPLERSDSRLWREALDRLAPLLIDEGIVVPPEPCA